MSIINDDPGNSKFPKSSRFFSQRELPDLKNFQLIRNNKQVSFNSQTTNINYNPFNSPQQKTKANFPLDFFHLSSKITLTDLPQDNGIPTIKLDESEAQDPIKIVEKYEKEGKLHGAIKIILPESIDDSIKSNFQINSDLFWFQTNKLLNNSSHDELQNRLKFHKDLVTFHLNNSNQKAVNLGKKSNVQGKVKANNNVNNDPNIIKSAEIASGKVFIPSEENLSYEENKFKNLTEIQIASILTGIEPEVTTSEPTQLDGDTQNVLIEDINNEKINLESNGESLDKLGNMEHNLPAALSQGLKSTESPTSELQEIETQILLQIHDGLKEMDAKNGKTNKSSSEGKKLPNFLNKLPMIDKRPLDLYKLYRSVLMRGGFEEVINKKLWAQIGRELGYKGKIMTSLSSSLKSSYLRILYPFELHMREVNTDIKNELNPPQSSEINNQNGKRELETSFDTSKKVKSEPPLIIGSSKEYKRSIKSKSSKGYLLNSPHLIDVKQPNSLIMKPETDTKIGTKKSTDIIESAILPQTQLNHALRSIYVRQSIIQDDSRLKSNGKFASIYSLRQFMEKDLKFQEYIILNNKTHFNKISTTSANFLHFNELNAPSSERNVIKFDSFEELYWNYIQNQNNVDIVTDGIELENGVDIPNSINGSGFAKLGDEFVNYKNTLNNININSSICKNNSIHSNSSNNGSIETSYFNSKDYSTKLLEASLNPWNLHNIAILPNSLLGALSDSDLNNQDLINTRLNIGMTFSTENWCKEDHFTQLCNYQFFGAYKRWYFIPELEFERFEKLILEVNEKYHNRINVNNQTWDIENLSKNMIEDGIEHDTLMNSLENMINPISDIRMKHSNVYFQKLIEKRSSSLRYNQEFLITPQMLDEKGIKYTTTIQKPGEMIIKYPKAFSSTLSFGMNLSEEVNFATKLWLDYALEGERLLSKESIIPNFSTFKLIVNLIQLYDSGKSIGFNSDIYYKIRIMYDDFYKKELDIRKKVRKLISFKELIIDEKFNGELDLISDDELIDTFPSKVVLIDTNNKQSFILGLDSFLENYKDKTIPFDEFKVELHLVYSDDKLKSFAKILQGYSINFDNWMKNYEKLMNENSEVTLKLYKSLLLEGEKIYSAISSSNFLSRLGNKDDYEAIKLNTFKSYIENLKIFLNESNQFIDSCQGILALKHQQRIRNGNEFQSLPDGLDRLLNLIKKIPTLNFSCPEIDQILELKIEIENFEKASRILLNKQSKNILEFDDLINLGESFGISLPSLNFLIRIRNRMKWISSFEIIDSGGDPYSDKKEIFSLQNLRDFFQEGVKILGSRDIEKVTRIKSILETSENFNHEVTKFLDVKFDDELQDDQLNEIIDRLKENNLFIDLNVYNRILDLQSNRTLIESFKDFKNSDIKFSYSDTKQLQNWICDSNLNFQISILQDQLSETDLWIFSVWNHFKDIKSNSLYLKKVYPEELNLKLTIHNELVDKISQLIYNLEFLESNDIYEGSSPYLAKFCKDSEMTQKFYCICRDLEYGTMIGCDRCNEWYHIQCLQDYVHTKDEEHYICPICKLVEPSSKVQGNFRLQVNNSDLMNLLAIGKNLKVVPTNELLILSILVEKFNQQILKLYSEVEKIKLVDIPEQRHYHLMFLLRKLYGGPIRNNEAIEKILKLLSETKIETVETSNNNSGTTSETVLQGNKHSEIENIENFINGDDNTTRDDLLVDQNKELNVNDLGS